jgi:hypothetical protein
MATIKILRDCVVAHQRRTPGDLVSVDEYSARQMADTDPDTFEWVDRPVKQFVDVQPAAPVGEDVVKTPSRRSARKLKKVDDLAGVAVEDDDGTESTE